jgi:hypothetical protein
MASHELVVDRTTDGARCRKSILTVYSQVTQASILMLVALNNIFDSQREYKKYSAISPGSYETLWLS